MSRPARAPLAAAALAGLLTSCAPGAFAPCNSDDDCTRRELCVDGYCGAIGGDDASDATHRERGPSARGQLIIGRGEGGDTTQPNPEPEPQPDPGDGLPDNWADPGLPRRAVVTIQGVAGVQQDIVFDVPVLVELDAAELGADFLMAARERVLFTTLEGAPLAAEQDSDRGQQLFFWVKHSFDPRVDLAVAERFYVYAGGETTLTAPDPREVWSTYFGVYHLDAPRELSQPDSAGERAGDNESAQAETVACTVGACLFFDGTDDRMLVRSDFPELAGATEATISATVRLTEITDSFIAVWSTPDRNRSRFFLGTDGAGVPQAAVRTGDASPTLHVAQGGPALAPGDEHRLDAVLDMVAGTIALYVDGQHRATDAFETTGALPATVSAEAALGAAPGSAVVDEFDGRVDEVRISGQARSPRYLKVDAASRAGSLTTVTLER